MSIASFFTKLFSAPEIPDQTFPSLSQVTPQAATPIASTTQTYQPPEFTPPPFPGVRIAQELVGPTLDTQSRKILSGYQFSRQGAIVMGSVDGPGVAISQSGIVGKNSSGVTTFAIDASTGNATFLGTIKVGTSIETGALVVGTNVGLGTAQDSAGVTTIIGNTVTTGYINALNVTANSVNAGWVYAGNISATQITTGTLSANFITGGSLVIGGSSDSLGVIVIKNGSGTEISKMNNSGIIVRNARGLFFEETNAGNFASYQVNSSNQMVLQLPQSTNAFLIKSTGDGITWGTNEFTISNTKAFFNHEVWFNSDIRFGDGSTAHEHNIFNVDQIKGYNDIRTYTDQVGDPFFWYNNQGGGNLSMFPYYGDFYATGTKYFKIPHPDDPQNKSIQYTSVESPEVALTIRGKAQTSFGRAIIETPHHWHLVTEDFLTTLNITPLNKCSGFYVSGLSNTGFELDTNNGEDIVFVWELTATRKGYSSFNPEPTVDDEAVKHAKAMIESEKLSIKDPIQLSKDHKAQRVAMRALIKSKYNELKGGNIK